jgi:hypothetical protein
MQSPGWALLVAVFNADAFDTFTVRPQLPALGGGVGAGAGGGGAGGGGAATVTVTADVSAFPDAGSAAITR